MVMWIIMGVLVSLIAFFLVFMSIKDRKKRKRKELENGKLVIKQKESIKNILVFLNEVKFYNENLLKEFVPSVGKLKMGDIRNRMVKILKYYKKTPEYIFASGLDENAKIINIYNLLEKTNSSIWFKKLDNEFKFISKKINLLEKDFIENYKKEVKKLIKGYI